MAPQWTGGLTSYLGWFGRWWECAHIYVYIVYQSPCTFTRWRQGRHFVAKPGCFLIECRDFEFTKWLYLWGLVRFPRKHRWTGKKTKICSLQDACPRFFWKLQVMSFCKLVPYRMVCLEVSPNCMPPTFPGNFRIFFSHSPKLRHTQFHEVSLRIGHNIVWLCFSTCLSTFSGFFPRRWETKQRNFSQCQKPIWNLNHRRDPDIPLHVFLDSIIDVWGNAKHH